MGYIYIYIYICIYIYSPYIIKMIGGGWVGSCHVGGGGVGVGGGWVIIIFHGVLTKLQN